MPLVALGWLLLSCYCALYTGAFLSVVSWLWYKESSGGKKESVNNGQALRNIGLIFAIPLLWVGFEYLRSTLFTGFPWNALGVSQFRNLAVIQLAEWGGVYAVSAIIVLMNTALAITALRLTDVYRHRRHSRFHIELMIGLLACALCWMHGVRTVGRLRTECIEGTELKVAAVQPNIPQLKKWPVEFAREIYNRLRTQTELALMGKPDLVIWPETAVPGPVLTDPESTAFVMEPALQGAPILVGSLEEAKQTTDHGQLTTDNIRYYNSSFLFSADGEIIQKYRKQHLVLFGECLPLDRKIDFIRKFAPLGFSCVPGSTNTVFRLRIAERGLRNIAEDRDRKDRIAFSVLICFEDVFAYLARESVRNGARFLINQTNDAWFDKTSAPVQHLSHCVFRCVENRVGAVRCANTGVTCFIDKTGRIENQKMLEREGWGMCVPGFKLSKVLVPGADMPLTFYTRYGDLPFALPCGIISVMVFAFVLITEKRKKKDET